MCCVLVSFPKKVYAWTCRGFTTRWCVSPWASYQIRKVAGCACAGNAGNVFPTRRLQRKPLVSDPGMHHGTCVTHVPWCMSGSLTCGGGENVPGIPSACAPAILRIWQEAHSLKLSPSLWSLSYVATLYPNALRMSSRYFHLILLLSFQKEYEDVANIMQNAVPELKLCSYTQATK